MKIIEWNCQGAFRKKNDKILLFKPDILIISVIIENAQKTDTFDFSENAFKEREILIKKSNKMLHIDKLIKEMYDSI